jgi:hypothetical protein
VILELLEYCLTPCSWTARSMGFLTSTIQVRARYKRCQSAWQPHLERTRAAILEAAERAPGRRKALLFGAGLLHDIPLSALAARFEEVVLADIVHSLPSRLAVLRFPNVRLLTLDVTGVMQALPRLRKNLGVPLPASAPRAFLEDRRLDFTASVNLVSQLGWVPGLVLDGARSEAELAAFQRGLVEAHLKYLGQLPGHTSLITDASWRAQPLEEGKESREWGVLHNVHLPKPDGAWDWRIAPAPERERKVDYTARVHWYADWKGEQKRLEGTEKAGTGEGAAAAKN